LQQRLKGVLNNIEIDLAESCFSIGGTADKLAATSADGPLHWIVNRDFRQVRPMSALGQ
jgi:hypothetical protein